MRSRDRRSRLASSALRAILTSSTSTTHPAPPATAPSLFQAVLQFAIPTTITTTIACPRRVPSTSAAELCDGGTFTSS